ncbi:MAG: transposase [Myxococcales bacterium]|nr:MAG: transposase [Myxococcales bacterium]
MTTVVSWFWMLSCKWPELSRSSSSTTAGLLCGSGFSSDFSDSALEFVFYKLKRHWADAAEAVVFEPLDLIAKLCALVLPPHFHLLRYHGVLAAHATQRSKVVPGPQDESNRAQLALWNDDPQEPRPKRTPWSKLLARVFNVDVSVCPSCGGHMKIIEFLDAQNAAGLPRAPPASIRAPQLPLPFAG